MADTDVTNELRNLRLAQRAHADQLGAAVDEIHEVRKGNERAERRAVAAERGSRRSNRMAVLGLILAVIAIPIGIYSSDIRAWLDGPSQAEAEADQVAEVFLGHPLDPSGQKYWAPRYERHGLPGLVKMVLDEKSKAPEMTDAEYVQALYRAFAGRAPDPNGFAGWLDALEGGTSRGEVARSFVKGLED